jgi:lipoprotein-anchoring transpeptidase ErfK/SrfK
MIAASAMLSAAACDVSVDTGDDDAGNQSSANQSSTASNPQQSQDPWQDPQAVARAKALAQAEGSQSDRTRMRDQARAEMQDLRLVVDQSDRELRIYRRDRLVRTHDVAVGTEKNPTPIGDFAFHRVDLNPRWVPPNSEWAEDREPKPAGHPENPMGRARLVYKMPYTIHGTDDLGSLGKAVSHGSIRLANEHVIPLAEMLLKAGNAWQGPKWFQKMVEKRNEEYQVALEQKVPLKIQE